MIPHPESSSNQDHPRWHHCQDMSLLLYAIEARYRTLYKPPPIDNLYRYFYTGCTHMGYIHNIRKGKNAIQSHLWGGNTVGGPQSRLQIKTTSKKKRGKSPKTNADVFFNHPSYHRERLACGHKFGPQETPPGISNKYAPHTSGKSYGCSPHSSRSECRTLGTF